MATHTTAHIYTKHSNTYDSTQIYKTLVQFKYFAIHTTTHTEYKLPMNITIDYQLNTNIKPRRKTQTHTHRYILHDLISKNSK